MANRVPLLPLIEADDEVPAASEIGERAPGARDGGELLGGVAGD